VFRVEQAATNAIRGRHRPGVAPRRLARQSRDGGGQRAHALTALVRNALRAYAVDGLAPGAALLQANDVVAHFTGPETFVTVFFGILDTDSGELTYSSAGHPPPVVIGERSSLLPSAGGPILGAFAGKTFAEGQAPLSADQTLVLYTDGVTEARDGDQGLYGEERLLKHAEGLIGESPDGMIRGIFEDVKAYADGELQDDVALVAVRMARPAESHPTPTPPAR